MREKDLSRVSRRLSAYKIDSGQCPPLGFGAGGVKSWGLNAMYLSETCIQIGVPPSRDERTGWTRDAYLGAISIRGN